MNIYTLSSAIYSALPDGYDTTVTNGTCLNDTIKVTKDNSHIVMYISQDEAATAKSIAANGTADSSCGNHISTTNKSMNSSTASKPTSDDTPILDK